MSTHSASPSTSFPPSPFRVRVRVRVSPLNIFVFLIFFAITIPTTTSIQSQSYSKHCGDFVPESPPTSHKLPEFELPQLFNSYFVGGKQILGQKSPQFGPISPKSVTFRTRNAYYTESSGVYQLDGKITFRSSKIVGFPGNSTRRRRLRLVHYRPPRIPVRMGEARFRLHGFWSSSSGKLCMIGAGLSYLRSVNVVLKLNYPNCSTIVTSLVNGTLESIDSSASPGYFDPISVLGVSLRSYNYTLLDTEHLPSNLESEKLDAAVCSMIRSSGSFELEYMNDCIHNATVVCNPLGRSANFVPEYMFFNEIKCLDNGRVRYLLEFSNYSYSGRFLSFDPNSTFVSEGVWDEKRKNLNLVACRVNTTDSVARGSIGDCSIRLSLSLRETLSLRNRSVLIGEIRSNRNINDSGYFSAVGFKSSANGNVKVKGLKYQYSEIDRVKGACAKKMKVGTKGGSYPNGYSSDMRFDMKVSNKKGKMSWGYSSPVFVGNELYKPSFASEFSVPSNENSVINMSYMLSFRTLSDFGMGGVLSSTKSIDISAEGTYDSKTGALCMIGCREVESLHKKLGKNESLDCEILVFVQFSLLNGKDGSHVKGTIESTRNTSDPLYFERLELSSNSIYTQQAEESIWRMDLEITMVLISNTLACVFVGLQLSYVKKHPEVIPFISLVMLIVLTLGHLIPLVLNFEALFLVNRNRQNVFLGSSGGWLEVNEVFVRVITMIAFLLQFRLLQLTYSARVGDESQKSLTISDKKALYISLPLYICGALVVWLLQKMEHHSHASSYLQVDQSSVWGNLKSYGGLVLDGFLLPQIVFNIFSDSGERSLSVPFYVGATVVRLLPHAYDLYRRNSSSAWYFNKIFANPRMDYYSTAWDVVIFCSGLLFVLAIFLQQKFGGRCIVPKRFRESYCSVYEEVPVVSSEDTVG